jgi:tripartite-type tricarboxylate transporter receptor subunit TctC
LAVSSPKRSSLLPNVPTTVEEGFANSDYTPWLGLFAPAKTPRSVIDRLHDAIGIALESPELQRKVNKLGFVTLNMSSDEFETYVQHDLARNADLVQKLRISH